MLLEFTKMHGLGNDFMVVDLISQRAYLDALTIQRLADRHFGIGFDQLLIVEPPDLPNVDFKYRIFNADGSEVEQCGNGVRCFARFVHERQLAIQENDVLAVLGAGAYGFVMSSNYNSRGRAAEVMVDGDQSHLIRERETIESLWERERLLP